MRSIITFILLLISNLIYCQSQEIMLDDNNSMMMDDNGDIMTADWNPSLVSNVAQWLESDRGVVQNGNYVYSITDLKNGYVWLQSNTSYQPLFTQTDAGINNHPSITLDGLNDRLTYSTGTTLKYGQTCYIVLKRTTSTSYTALAEGTASNVYMCTYSNTNQGHIYYGATNGNSYFPTANAGTTYHVVEQRMGANKYLKTYKNKVLVKNSSTQDSTLFTGSIGGTLKDIGLLNRSTYGAFSFCFIFIVDAEITNGMAVRNNIYTYLNKYGFTF